MKSKMRDKYFTIDIINVILCSAILILSAIFLIDITQHEELVAYIILLGGVVNMLSGIKGLKKNNSGKLLLVISAVLFIMLALIFFGFGGF